LFSKTIKSDARKLAIRIQEQQHHGRWPMEVGMGVDLSIFQADFRR